MFLTFCFVSLLKGCLPACGVGSGLKLLNDCSLNKLVCICLISSFMTGLNGTSTMNMSLCEEGTYTGFPDLCIANTYPLNSLSSFTLSQNPLNGGLRVAGANVVSG